MVYCTDSRMPVTLTFDEAFVARLRSRDSAAEADLVAVFTRPIRAKLRRHLRNPQLVDEACQETFLRIFNHFQSGKPANDPARFPAFVHSVSHNVAMEMVRSSGRHPQLPVGIDQATSAANPEQTAASAESRLLVQRILGEMSLRDREILRLVLLEEEDRDEVCTRFQVDREALRVLLHRAKQRFRLLLESGTSASLTSPKGMQHK